MKRFTPRTHFSGPDSPIDEDPQEGPYTPGIAGAIEEGSTTIVAVIGYADDWAAYRGSSAWSLDEISSQGDKILEEEARRLFSTLNYLRYRP